MNDFWLKVKVWTKTTLAAMLAIYVLIFIYNNSGERHTVSFWWWIGHEPQTSVFVLSALAFIAGMIAAVLIRTTLVTLRQIRTLQERATLQKAERIVKDQTSKAGRLQTRPAPPSSASGGAFEVPDPPVGTDDRTV